MFHLCLSVRKGKRLDQPTVSGWDRININGLLNAHDVTDVILQECPSVNSDSTITLYKEALEKHSDAQIFWQHRLLSTGVGITSNSKLSRAQFAIHFWLTINLIERLWQFLRKEIINTKFYRTKHEFRDAVLKFFGNIASYRKETRFASNSELPRAQFAIHFWLTITTMKEKNTNKAGRASGQPHQNFLIDITIW